MTIQFKERRGNADAKLSQLQNVQQQQQQRTTNNVNSSAKFERAVHESVLFAKTEKLLDSESSSQGTEAARDVVLASAYMQSIFSFSFRLLHHEL